MTEAQAVDALIETARFAASILREIETSRKLGTGSLAGQAIEAGSRLLANANLIEELRFLGSFTDVVRL